MIGATKESWIYLYLWIQSKIVIDCMNLPCNKTCSRKKPFEANDRLFLQKNWSCRTMVFLTGQNVELMDYLLYSFNLAPNNFCLSPHIKKYMVAEKNGWYIQIACFVIGVQQVLQKLVQTHAKVLILMGNILKNNEDIFRDKSLFTIWWRHLWSI